VERSQSGPIFGSFRGSGLISDLSMQRKNRQLPLEQINEEDEKMASDGTGMAANQSQRALIRHSDLDIVTSPFRSRASGNRA
jgi:hypothetical protein